jgi:lactoylglutathione lyase
MYGYPAVKYKWSTLLVKDMEESLSFYRDVLGLRVAGRESVMPGLEIAFLDTGETQIELVMSADGANAVAGDAVSWGFEVDSLDDVLKRVAEKHIPLLSGPFLHPNVKFFFIQDPNGLKIELKEILE